MQTPAEILEAILDAEQEKFSGLEGLPGSAVANIIREMDIVYLYLRGSSQFTPEYTEFFETIHQYGWPPLLQAWYSKIEHAKIQPVLYSSSSITAWADSTIHATGKLAFARQLVMFCKMGFATLSQAVKNEFVFTITEDYLNTEFYDLHDSIFVQKHVIDKFIRQKSAKDPFDLARVQKSISRSVRSPDRRSITYQSTSYVTRSC